MPTSFTRHQDGVDEIISADHVNELQVALEWLTAGVHNALEYGAAGDGVSNDTEPIQDAIDAAAADGGVVFLPAGEYLVDGLTLTSPTPVTGAGIDRTTLTAAPGATNVITIGDGVTTINYSYVQALAINGNANATRGVYLRDLVVRSTIRDVLVMSCVTGVENENRNYSTALERCVVTANATGVRLVKRAQDAKLSNCQVFGNTVAQIVVGDGTEVVSLVTLENTQIERTTTPAATDVDGLVVEAVNMLTLRSCYLETKETANSPSIRVEGNALTSTMYVESCLFLGNSAVNYAVVLPGDTSPVNVTFARCVFSSYLQATPIQNLTATGKRVWMLPTWGGEVGYGVYDPAADFDVEGTAHLGGATSIDGVLTLGSRIEFNTGAGGVINVPDGQNLTLNYQNGTNVIIHDGNAGAGDEVARFTPGSGLRPGPSGNAFIKGWMAATAQHNFGSLGAGTTGEFTISVPGAASGDIAIADPVGAVESSLIWQAWVSAADTVTVRVVAIAPVDPANRTWGALVLDLT